MTIDLGIPRLLDAIHGKAASSPELVEAVNAKNRSQVEKTAGKASGPLVALMDMPIGDAGALEKGLKGPLAGLPKAAAAMLKELVGVADRIREAMPGASVTVDPLEQRGFDYHHGMGFSIFAPGIRGELGRGGRYRTSAADGRGEESTGVTLYLERVLRAMPAPGARDMVYIPAGAGSLKALVEQAGKGRAAVIGSVGGAKKARLAEARALGCSHWLADGDISPLSG